MVDVTTETGTSAAAGAKGPSPPLSTDGGGAATSTRSTRRSPQKPHTPTPTTRATRSSTSSTNSANGATTNGVHAAPGGPRSASGGSVNGGSTGPAGSAGMRATPQRTQSANTSPQRPKSEAGSSRRRKPLFVSCVTYPETAPVPIVVTKDGAEPQRSQRKSKVEAMNKIDRAGTPSTVAAGPAATSFVPPPPPPAGPSVARNPLKRPRVVNPPFDYERVRKQQLYDSSTPDQPTRAFGLPTCPTYHPTAEQFRDPMAYIESISSEAKAYGICKIIPPEGWRMPFVMDTDNFRFMTRLQRLNSIEAASRAKINFLEQLSMFHKQQGDAGAHVPIINHKLLDVWRLRKEVNKLGGIDEVNRLKAWPKITELLGFTQAFVPQIRSAYTKLILPFENWALRAKSYPESPLTPLPTASANGKVAAVGSGPHPHGTPDTPMGAKQGRMTGMRTSPRGRATSLGTGPAGTGGSALNAAIGFPDQTNANANAGPSSDSGLAAPIRIKVSGFQTSSHGSDSELSEEESSRTASQLSTPPRQPPKYEKGDVCEICTLGNNAAKILLCDGCDRGFHTFCLDPPLSEIPTNEWFCTACLLGNGDDFGFDEGEEHSLASFQARDQAFSEAWFNRYAPGPFPKLAPGLGDRTLGRVVVTEADVEREFWRLVESQDDTVEVEYGADVHSTTHGSAAPTTETHPTSTYARDPWNLNNMAIVRDSLLRYIKSDISGMTVPWIYVGMLFSAFCWHNEDHYTYSVNYQFWGETKTWYGIPGDGAEKFEAAMRREAPELFERQPSLLYQLVTIMNPGRLRDEGVPVYACDQRPNEFVITFPKAYHCGFNHGLNFNEAVNFALPDWLSLGKESVERYREHAKQPVFSHEELLITITLYSDTIKTALWLQEPLRVVVKEEIEKRNRLRAALPDLTQTLVEEDVPEEQYQCCVCKGFCYLAQMTCSCTKLVTCLDHQEYLCSCPTANRVLRQRYSDAQLEDILDIVVTRASQPEQWRSRFDNALQVARPQLKTIRQLVADGERIPYDLPGLEDLREFVAHANAWVERASAVFTRKSTGRRRKGRQSEATPAIEEDDVDRSPAALRALLQEADQLAFDAPEILQLRQMISSFEDFRREAQEVLSLPEDELDYERCKTTLILGQSLNVQLPEITALTKIVSRLDWYHKIEEEVDDRMLEYGDIVQLLQEAKEYGIPDDYHGVVELRRRAQKGVEWQNAVAELLAQESITIDEISRLIEGHDDVPITVEKMRQLENMRKTAQTWQQTAQNLLTNQGSTIAATRLCKAVSSADSLLRRVQIPEVAKLRAELDYSASWTQGVATFLDVNANKVQTSITNILRDLQEHLEPTDDEPNDQHTCFCRGRPTKTMVTCPTCSGEYHPKCVNITAKTEKGIAAAAENFKCQMCQNLQYDDRPTIHELGKFADTAKWSFVLTPPGFESLGEVIQLARKYALLVIPLYEHDAGRSDTISTMPTRTPTFPLVGHLLRKIWTLPVQLTATRSEQDEATLKTKYEELYFEPWLYARLRSFIDKDTTKPTGSGRIRARKPKFTFTRANPHTFTCICRTEPLDYLLTVTCSKCEQGFHMSCVGAPISATAADAKWRCPFCIIKAGKAPARLDLRCQMFDKTGTDEFIDWRQTIHTYAQEPIPVTLPLTGEASRPIVILEVSKFTPPAVPDGFEPPVWTEADELGIDKRKRRRTGDAPNSASVVSTPGSTRDLPPMAPAGSTPSGSSWTPSALPYKPAAGPGPVPGPSAAGPSTPTPNAAHNPNVRMNGSHYYPTHSAVPWENKEMFNQFPVNPQSQQGPWPSSSAPHARQPAPGPGPVPVANGTATSAAQAGTVVPPRPTAALPLQRVPASAQPVAHRPPVPGPAPAPAPAQRAPAPAPVPAPAPRPQPIPSSSAPSVPQAPAPAQARPPVPAPAPAPAPPSVTARPPAAVPAATHTAPAPNPPAPAVVAPVTPAPAPAAAPVAAPTPSAPLASPTVPAKRAHPDVDQLDAPMPPVKRHSPSIPQSPQTAT